MNSFIESIFGRSVGVRQIAIIGVGLLVTAMIFAVTRYGVEPTMVPLYSGVEAKSMGPITDKLTELSIASKVSDDGTSIMVKQEDLAKARVAIAREGLAETGRPGWGLFDKATWGMTDFTQKVNFARALEGELENTISKMRDIQAASVHLALEDDALFKTNERPSKASVTLTMKSGDAPAASVVQGIARLVAGGVGGLDAAHVTIVDDQGHALTTEDDGTPAGRSTHQLAVQHEMETDLARKGQELLQSIVGAGNSKVQVTAMVNFDKLERTTQAVDPDKQATSSEQRAEVTPSAPTQGAGYSTVATSFENSRSMETFVGTSGNLKKLSVAVLIADKVTIPPVDTTAKTPAAPIITPRTPEELAKIETLMRNALGVDSTRGDNITVQSATFELPIVSTKHDTLPTPNMITRLQSNPKPPLAIGAVVALLILAIVMVIALKPKKIVEAAPAQLAAGGQNTLEMQAFQQQQQLQQQAGLQQQQEEDEYGIEKPKLQYRLPAIATSAEREQAIATVDQRPEAAIRVTKNWLRT